MQAQSRLGVSGGGMSSASDAELEAVIRELTRGRQLTARLRAEALRVLRGQGQAEATAALILQEVSRAFTVCLNIMGSPAGAPPPPEMPGLAAAAAAAAPPFLLAPPRRNREDSIPRVQTVTPSPHYDGYQWRKYGQKRITKTHYPRCYYRCSFHRERGCRATKQVQQCSGGDQPQYLVIYFYDHTCDTAAWEPEAPANPPAATVRRLDLPGAALLDERGVQEEQVLVSTLACVLGGQQQFHQAPPAPDAAATSAAIAVNEEPAPVVDAAAGMPRLDVDGVGLDVMDYEDVAGELCFGDGDSYGLPGSGGGGGLPF